MDNETIDESSNTREFPQQDPNQCWYFFFQRVNELTVLIEKRKKAAAEAAEFQDVDSA